MLCIPTGFTPTQVGFSAYPPLSPATAPAIALTAGRHDTPSLSRLWGDNGAFSCSVTLGRDVPSWFQPGKLRHREAK